MRMWSILSRSLLKSWACYPAHTPSQRVLSTCLLLSSSRERLLSTTNANDGNDAITSRFMSDYSSHIDGKYMQKLLYKRGAKTKRKWYQPHLAEPLEPLSGRGKSRKPGEVSEAQRTRARQLAHILYDRITHIIITGELSQDIQAKQVFITEVKMHPNFGGINVMWEAQRSDAHEVEQLLQTHAGKLRSLLISYHVLGKIPPIYFVRSKGTANTEDLDKLLEIADYGPDYQPSDSVLRARRNRGTGKMLSSSQTESPADDSIITTQRNSVQEYSFAGVSTFLDNSGIPEELEFWNNLYGLPVEDLMKKIHAKKNKVRVAQENMGSVLDAVSEFERSKKLSAITKSFGKHKRYKDSSKIKQRRLEMDPEDFRMENSSSGSTFIDVEDDYNDMSNER